MKNAPSKSKEKTNVSSLENIFLNRLFISSSTFNIYCCPTDYILIEFNE